MASEYDTLLAEPPADQKSPYDVLLSQPTPQPQTPSIGQIISNAGAAALETAKGFIPRSVEQVAGLVTPVVGAVEDIGKAGRTLTDAIFGGKNINEAVATNFPESTALVEADQTAPYSKERFKAGFDTLAQLGMAAGLTRGFQPKLTETIFGKQPEVAPEAPPEAVKDEPQAPPARPEAPIVEPVAATAEAQPVSSGGQPPSALDQPKEAGAVPQEQVADTGARPVSETWYHGSGNPNLTEIKPGMPSKDKIDVPRQNAVYLTKNREYASERGQNVYQAKVNPRDLIPDEDAVFEKLPDDRELQKLWQEHSGVSWQESEANYAESENFSQGSQELIHFSDWLAEKHPDVAQRIIQDSGSAAYRGTLPVDTGSKPAVPVSTEGEATVAQGNTKEVTPTAETPTTSGEVTQEGQAAPGVPASQVPFIEGSPQIAGQVPFEEATASGRRPLDPMQTIKVRPLSTLKSIYGAAEKSGEAGYARGLDEARTEGRSAVAQIKSELNVADKWMAGDQENVRQHMVEFVNKTLPPAERGRFIGAITNALKRPALQGGDPAVMYKNAFRVMRSIENRSEDVFRNDLIGNIKTALSKSVDAPGIDVEYRRRLRGITNDISLTKPTERTTSRLESLQSYVDKEKAAGREPNVPQEEIDQLAMLHKLPLRDMPTNALEQLHDNIQSHVQLGRLKAKLLENQWDAQKTRAVTELTNEPSIPLEKREIYRPQPTEGLSIRQKFFNGVSRAINANTNFQQAIAPMDEIYDHLGGATGTYDTWPSRNIKGKLDLAFNEREANRQPILDESRAIAKRYSLTNADFETVGVRGIMDMVGRERLEAMDVNKDILNRIESTPLTKGQQAYRDYTRKVYDQLGGSVRNVAHRLYQEDVGIVDNYVPLQRDWALHAEREAPAPMQDPISGEIPFNEKTTLDQLRNDYNPKIISRTEQSFLKDRVEGAKTAIKLNAQDVFERHLTDALHFIHTQPTLKMLAEIARTPAFETKYGRIGQEIVLDHLDSIANQGYANHLQRVRWLDWVRNSTSKGAVGFRIASNIVHASQLPLAAYHAGGAGWWTKGLELALSEKGQNFLRKNAAETYVRSGGEPAQAEVEAFSKFGKAGFFVARNIDKLNSQATFLGRYAKEMQKSGTPVDTVLDFPVNSDLQALALQRMHRAVASPQAKDIPQMTSRGKGVGGNVSVARAINQFRNIFLDNWSNIRHDVLRVGEKDSDRIVKMLHDGEIASGTKEIGDAASHRAAVAAAVLAGIAMETGIKMYVKQGIQAATSAATGIEPHKTKGQEEKTYLGELQHHAINRIPFVGQLATAMLYGETGVPVVDSLVAPLKESGLALFKSKKPETTAKHVVRAGSAALTLAGIPGSSQALEAAEPVITPQLGKVLPDRSSVKPKGETGQRQHTGKQMSGQSISIGK